MCSLRVLKVMLKKLGLKMRLVIGNDVVDGIGGSVFLMDDML